MYTSYESQADELCRLVKELVEVPTLRSAFGTSSVAKSDIELDVGFRTMLLATRDDGGGGSPGALNAIVAKV